MQFKLPDRITLTIAPVIIDTMQYERGNRASLSDMIGQNLSAASH